MPNGRITYAALAGAIIAWGSPSARSGAADAEIFVVLDAEGLDAAQAAAAGDPVVKGLTAGFQKAAAALSAGAGHVVLNVAAGGEHGDWGSGGYQLPRFDAPAGTLEIRGGYSKDFKRRSPFRTPTRLTTVRRRMTEILAFSPRCRLKGFVLDGVLIDVSASNAYDARNNSLLTGGGTATRWMIRLNNLETDLLAIRNCTFLNASMRVCETTIRAASDDATIEVSNNLFINNRVPLKIDAAYGRHVVARAIIRNNSFLRNWPYNPDPNTAMPAALEFGGNHAARQILVEGNLFFQNVGGAMMQVNKEGPPLVIRGNNFFGNGLLHNDDDSAAAALIANAGNSFVPVGLSQLSRIGFATAKDNVSIDPKLPDALTVGRIRNLGDAPEEGDEDTGELVATIKGFAPKYVYDPEELPLASGEAAKYGAREAFSEEAQSPLLLIDK